MTIAPPTADMKRGALGPSPVRRNTLWNERRARAAAQYCADVSARNRETGEFVQVTANFGGEIVDGELVPDRRGMEAISVFRAARNRAACRQGHVLVGKYRAARLAEQRVPAPVAVGPDRWAVDLNRPVEGLPVGGASHSGAEALAAILAVHAKCVESRG